MSRRRFEPPLDDEVLELLRDDPELLAIADALRATRPRRRGVGRGGFALIAAVAVLIAVVAVLRLMPSSPGLVDRALAAVGERPLLRAVFTRALANDELVDLSSGRSRPSTVRVTAIVDDQSGRMRVIVAHNGVVVQDSVAANGVPGASVGVDQVLANFARRYRPSLRTGRATSSRVDGLPTLALAGTGIAVDLDTNARPTRIRGRTSWRVQAIGSTAGPNLLAPRRRSEAIARGDVVARTALRQAPSQALAGAGRVPRVAGYAIERVVTERLRSVTVGGKRSYSSGLRFDLSGPRGRLTVLESRTPEAAYGFGDGYYTFDSNPIPSRYVDLHSLGTSWIGQLRVGVLYVTVHGLTRASVLAAVRSLRH
jgi:hypothetical protein